MKITFTALYVKLGVGLIFNQLKIRYKDTRSTEVALDNKSRVERGSFKSIKAHLY